MDGRHGGDAQVEGGAVGGGQGDAAVQGQPFFRNADVRHDLDAADDARLEPLGRIPHLLEVAVNAVAKAEPFFQGFQVDVAGPEAVGLQNEAVDHPDDGRVALLGLALSRGAPRGLHLELLAAHVGHERLQGLVRLSEETDDGLVDFFQRDHHGFDVGFEKVAQGVEGFEVHRVGNRHAEPGGQPLDGEGVVTAAFPGGDGGKDILVHLLDGGGELKAAFLGDKFEDLVAGEQAPLDDALQSGETVDGGFLLTGGQVLGGYRARVLQEIHHVGFVGNHGQKYVRRNFSGKQSPAVRDGQSGGSPDSRRAGELRHPSRTRVSLPAFV